MCRELTGRGDYYRCWSPQVQCSDRIVNVPVVLQSQAPISATAQKTVEDPQAQFLTVAAHTSGWHIAGRCPAVPLSTGAVSPHIGESIHWSFSPQVHSEGA